MDNCTDSVIHMEEDDDDDEKNHFSTVEGYYWAHASHFIDKGSPRLYRTSVV